MSKTTLRVTLVLGLVTTLGIGSPASAQIPEEFSNLQLLPKDIGQRDLVNIMRAFAGALGVRCNHCHDVPNPETLEGSNFASDDKETKQIARVMMRMTDAINGTHLPEIGRSEITRVKCATCHHGLAKPTTLRDELLTEYGEKGVDGVKAMYEELREKYYGEGVFNFNQFALTSIAERLAMDHQDMAGAKAMLEYNLEFFPDSAYTYGMIGRLGAMSGDTAGAIAAFEKALELEPENDWFKGQLARLKGDAQ